LININGLRALSATLTEHAAGVDRTVHAWRQGVTDMDTLVRELGERQRQAAAALQLVDAEIQASVRTLTAAVDGGPV
jgi:hypothetical protein